MRSAPTRRQVLRGASAASLVAGGLLFPRSTAYADARAAGLVRDPDSLPRPHLAPGTPDASMPFDHIVVLMMENHSFDNYFGMLPLRGQPLADGFTFDKAGRPVNSNPLKGGHVTTYRLQSTCQAGVSQSWSSSHHQIDGGKMDGFAADHIASMGYYDEPDLPFYYSLAKTFTLANRWFCSTPCQTYPNRRFLYAGTAYGIISTDFGAILTAEPPPNGTIFDRLSDAGVSWKSYFTDLPAVGIIPSNVEKHPLNFASSAQFITDALAGTLPAVSFVDPEFGALNEVGSNLRKALGSVGSLPPQVVSLIKNDVEAQGGDEETPQDVRIGELFVSQIVNAVLKSPLWERTLLVWTYDEHGGYYDHVAPPAAIKPDAKAPMLGPKDPPGGYDLYGPRVPTVVVSPYSKPHAVTNVVHDHTSVLATIEKKWNLPALTARDANATDLMDFLDTSKMSFQQPPALAAAALVNPLTCSTAEPNVVIVDDEPVTVRRRLPRKTHTSSGGRSTSPPHGSLAATGLDAALPVAAAGLTVAAAALVRARRTDEETEAAE